MMKIKCKQVGLEVKHHGAPNFQLKFEDKPLEVLEAVGNFLLKDNPELFELVGKGDGYDASLDFNKDGKNDEKDASLGAKAMARARKNKKKGD